MTRLSAQYTSSFLRDVKRLRKKHVDDAPLAEVIDLILENTSESLDVLRRRHNMQRPSRVMGWQLGMSCLQRR